MPTRKRRERAEELKRARTEEAQTWAEFDSQMTSLDEAQRAELAELSKDESSWNVPPHALKALSNVGLTFDVDGEPAISAAHGVGGNDLRAADKADKVRDLKGRYADIWGTRGAAKVIARKENCSVETIRRYFRMTP